MKPVPPRLLVFCALFFSLVACAQFSPPSAGFVRSISGQFIVIGSAESSPLARSPDVFNNTNLVRLEPALLAVSAERIKESVWRKLGIGAAVPWRGRIFLALHPARSLDEEVTIFSKASANGWSYEVQLPDVLSRARFSRALTGALLLEFANRGANPGKSSAEIPAWFAEGLSQQLLTIGSSAIILSSPEKIVNGLPVARTDLMEKRLDPFADARRVLKNFPTLTFEQLSWPTVAQLSGADGGVFRASSQLFVGELLALKDGPAHLRALLENLPRYYNWQTAFQSAFRENFSSPLDVEKWWALRVVGFAAHEPGPQWTLAVSRDKLDEILSVPVDVRASSNALPARTEISLQAVIRNFDPTRQTAILQTKLRDLELAQFRIAPQLAALNDAYRRAVAGYLGLDKKNPPVHRAGRVSNTPGKISARDTLKKLDALDAQRRNLQVGIKPGVSFPTALDPRRF